MEKVRDSYGNEWIKPPRLPRTYPNKVNLKSRETWVGALTVLGTALTVGALIYLNNMH